MTQDPAKPQQPQSREKGTPKKVRLALTALVAALIVVTAIGLFVSQRERLMSDDPGSRFSSSLQKLEGGGISIEFRTVRELPAGPGLNDWLESVPSKSKITGVHAEAIATYFLDARADWDVAERDGKTIVTIPAPDLKSVVLDRTTLRIDSSGELPAEDARLAREILEEKLPSFLRQDEEPRRPERIEPIREKAKIFATAALKQDDVEVQYPGEGGSLEDSP